MAVAAAGSTVAVAAVLDDEPQAPGPTQGAVTGGGGAVTQVRISTQDHNGTENADSWEGHAFSRSRRIVNSTGNPINVGVQVQAAVISSGSSSVTFQLDDIHVRAMSIAGGFGL